MISKTSISLLFMNSFTKCFLQSQFIESKQLFNSWRKCFAQFLTFQVNQHTKNSQFESNYQAKDTGFRVCFLKASRLQVSWPSECHWIFFWCWYFYYRSVQEKANNSRRRTCFDVPTIMKSPVNPILDQTISVKSTLRALKLEHLQQIFDKEEINTLLIFFTLSEKDLEFIGVDDAADRKKVLDFIASFKSPPTKNVYRFRT